MSFQETRQEVAVLRASAAAAGALNPVHRRTDATTQAQATQTTDTAIATLKEQLAAAVRTGEGYCEELAEARVQAEEAVGLMEALEAQLEAVKAQVNPASGVLGYTHRFLPIQRCAVQRNAQISSISVKDYHMQSVRSV